MFGSASAWYLCLPSPPLSPPLLRRTLPFYLRAACVTYVETPGRLRASDLVELHAGARGGEEELNPATSGALKSKIQCIRQPDSPRCEYAHGLNFD